MMTALTSRLLSLLTVLFIASSVSACGAQYMTQAPTPTVLMPTRGDATVVFLRPSRFGGSHQVHIAADTVGYLGTVTGEQKLVTKVAAGSHLFYSWAENTDVVSAELAPGKVYYLLVGMRMGVWNARHSLSRFTSDRAEWTRFQDFLESTQEVVRKTGDAGRGPSATELKAQLEKARVVWEGLQGTARTLRTVSPEDGQAP